MIGPSGNPMTDDTAKTRKAGVTRRDFMRSTAAAGVGFALSGPAQAGQTAAPQANPAAPAPAKPAPKPDDLRIALIGTGEQGRILMESCLHIPGIRIAAVCDIWSYSQQYARG